VKNLSLIAWYKLDGNALDSSGNNLNLSTLENTTVDNSGKIGNAYLFTTNSRIYSSSGFSFPYTTTTCAWGYATSYTNTMLFSYNSASFSGVDLFFTSNTITWNTGDSANNPFKNNGVNVTQPSLNEWHHYCVINDSIRNKTYLYVDGMYYGEALYRSTYQVNRGFTIGNYIPSNSSYAWIGKIDDLRIYDHALSSKEIKELSKAKVLHYNFNDFQEPTKNIYANYGNLETSQVLQLVNTSGLLSIGDNTAYNNEKYYVTRVIKIAGGASGSDSFRFCVPSGGLGNKFNVSYKVKIISGDISSIGVHLNGGNASVSYKFIDSKGWYNFYTSSTTAHSSTLCVGVGFVGSNNLDCLITEPQLEFKEHTTPFVNGTRQGKVKDISGYQNNADLSISTTPKWVSDSKIGSGAYEFNGTSYSIERSPIMEIGLNDFSMSLWIKTSGTNSVNQTIGGFRETTSPFRQFHIFIGDSITTGGGESKKCVVFNRQNADPSQCNVKSNLDVVTGEWVHICAVRTKNSTKLYINGNLDSQNTTTQDINISGQYSFRLAWSGSDSPNFSGNIDDVRVYSSVLSDSDVKELYQTRASLDDNGNLFVNEIKNLPLDVSVFTTPSGSSHDGSYGLRFTVSKPLTIRSALVRPYFSGNMTARLYNFSNLALLQETPPIQVTSGINQRVNLNLNCEPNIEYWLTTTGGNFMRTDAGVSFPISDGLFNFTIGQNSSGSTADRWYYFFGIKYGERDSLNEKGVQTTYELSETQITDGLVAWYPFEGTAKDISGNAYHGTVSGATLVSGINGLGYEFNGTSNFIRNQRNFNPKNMTVSLWVWVNTAQNWSNRFDILSGTSTGGNGRILLYRLNSTTMRFYITFDGTLYTRDVPSSVSNLTGKWCHLALLSSDSTQEGFMQIYTNGVAGTPTSVNHAYTFNNQDIYFMSDRGVGNFTNGKLDDVRIYNRTLSSDEIKILYEMTNPQNQTKMKVSNNGTLYLKGQVKEV